MTLPPEPRAGNISSWVQAAAQALESSGAALGQGCWNASDEAHWLVLGALGLPLDTPLDPAENATHGTNHGTTLGATTLAPHQQQRLHAVLHARIVQRQPTAYILGEAWLGGLAFHADPRAIIPRSFLAFPLLDQEITLDHQEQPAILELCTGGGSLAVIAALTYPEARVLATDLSAEALALAQTNVARYELHQRIELRQGDLFDALGPTDPAQFDLILCNPPYVPLSLAATFPPEFQAEPAMAHFSGPAGTDLIGRLILALPSRLAPGGQLLLEVGREADSVEPWLEHLPLGYMHDWLDAPAQERAMLWVGAPSSLATHPLNSGEPHD